MGWDLHHPHSRGAHLRKLTEVNVTSSLPDSMVGRAQRSVAAIRLEKKIIKQAGTHQKCKRKSSGQAGTATFNSF